MESKLAGFLCCAAVLFLTVFSTAYGFSGSGSGIESAPYVITNVGQLQEMNNDPCAYYVLGGDIDAWDTENWNGGEGFVPIGPATSPFMGVLDGMGRSIDGLLINRINEVHQGLFGTLDGAVITNVHLTNASVTFDMYGGTLAANANNETVVTFCSATGSVTLKPGSSGGRGGGLIGNVRTGSRVERCWADVDVSAGGRSQVGGLVGYLRGVDAGPVAVLLNSYSLGTVTGTGSKQGNLLGDADGSQVHYCYSAGYGKALIGHNYRHPIIRNCYWDSTNGASSSSCGGSPRTTEQMMQQATFAEWDFFEIWEIVENETYPYLVLPVVPLEVAVDVKPGSCPNPLNLKSRGVLPVAILGSEAFDVAAIDIASIRLEGVTAVRSAIEDVAAPVVDGNECDCSEAGGDGYADLVLKFKTQDIVEALALIADDLASGDGLSLALTGNMGDGTPIEGGDCIVIVGKIPNSILSKKADINQDGLVNALDFSMMARYWLESSL